MDNKVQLLSTAHLDGHYTEKAASAGMQLDTMPFIQVNTITDETLNEALAELCRQQLTVVFTSASAVKAIRQNIKDKQPDWKIYCIVNATKKAALEYFDPECILGTASNAGALAGLIKAAQEKDVIFFCGDRRMDTLPVSLQQAGIAVKEVVVYAAEETPHGISKAYDGILFFSPSGVNSFFSRNKVGGHTVLFAIGHTTANAIKKHSDNLVVNAENPSKGFLIQQAINYFHKKDNSDNNI